MKVYRLEFPKHRVGGWSKTLRPERYGAFQCDLIPPELYETIPNPWQDFGNGTYTSFNHEPTMFFAFPDLGYIKAYAKEIHSDVLVAEYEVSPLRKSQYQVIFYDSHAVFLREQPITAFRDKRHTSDTIETQATVNIMS